MTDLILIRHGQATHNLEVRWEGATNSSLTEVGYEQAEAVATRLASWEPRICDLYSSPIRRARQTAEAIARRLGLKVTIRTGLREIDFGNVSGLTRAEFQASLPAVYARWQDRRDQSFAFPGGEQRQAFHARVARTLDALVRRHPQGAIVIVAHGGTLRAGLAHLLPDTMSERWSYSLDNGSLTLVRTGAGAPLLLALNDCAHLGPDTCVALRAGG